MLKNKLIRKISLVVIVIIFAVISGKIVKGKLNENKIINIEGYLFYNIDRNKFHFDKIEEQSADASIVLQEALTGFYNWDQLPLTEKFKVKFKNNRKNIISDVYDLELLSNYATEKNGENIIVIYGDRYDNILTDKILPPIATIYEFKYSVVDGKLDDVKIVEKYNVDATTGKRFFVKDDSQKFEP